VSIHTIQVVSTFISSFGSRNGAIKAQSGCFQLYRKEKKGIENKIPHKKERK